MYIDEYDIEKQCTYKGEVYSVRDNGAIMRHCREGKPKRANDEKWSFGNNDPKGYRVFCSEKVHRIVATAFHGEPPSKQHVVDHYDTNRQNNRPENLRWVTKLENILLNPYTRDKIIHICGSIESFLNDPGQLFNHESQDTNFSWMRAVTKQEAENTLKNLDWIISHPTKKDNSKALDEWIFQNEEQIPSITSIPKKSEISKKEEITVDKKEVLKIIRETCESQNWKFTKGVTVDNIKISVLVEVNEEKFGFILVGKRYPFNIEETYRKLKDNNIFPCWLNLEQKNLYVKELECFKINNSSGKLLVYVGRGIQPLLSDFLISFVEHRYILKNEIEIKQLVIMPMWHECYACKAKYNSYYIKYAISVDDGEIYLDDDDLVWNLDVYKKVKEYAALNPQLGLVFGKMKNRYSYTRQEEYISFGCQKCDAILGEWYYMETVMEYANIEDSELAFTVDFKTIVPYKYWTLDERV